jgi:chorismate mutase/GNAT superfamily N-acetyltransferase
MRPDDADLRLRPAGPEDAAVLAELFLSARDAAYPAMPRPVHPPEEVRAWLARRLGEDRAADRSVGGPVTEAWLAERAGDPVGYLLLEGDWLHSLYVRPGLTGQGIGSVLLDVAKGLRPDGFALWVFERNTGARRFYVRHGLWELEHTDGSANEERTPDLRMVWPGRDPVGYLRREVDRVDDELADALNRRAALTAAIQQHKEVPGHPGRDRRREAEIAARMARHAPALGADRLAVIMDAVISVSLDAADTQAGRPGGGPAGDGTE